MARYYIVNWLMFYSSSCCYFTIETSFIKTLCQLKSDPVGS